MGGGVKILTGYCCQMERGAKRERNEDKQEGNVAEYGEYLTARVWRGDGKTKTNGYE